MPKGMFTQGLCVLLNRVPTLDEVESTLNDFEICKRIEANEEWTFGGPTLVVAYELERNGLVSVDIVDRQWPDHMGDNAADTMIFGVKTIVSYLSQCMSLQPGDVIATGTPPGVGQGMNPPTFLKAGDEVETSVAGLGTQKQTVIEP